MAKTKTAPRPKTIKAAGGVVWRDVDGAREVLVVHRPRYDDWSLPKGKRKSDEPAPAAAIREIDEETGHRVRLGPELHPVRYRFDGAPKEVRYWLAEVVDGGSFEPNREVDQIAWWSVERAERELHPNDRGLVHLGARRAQPGAPLVIVRHALSSPRKQWKGDDRERPLSREGEAQAVRLVALLSAWSPTRIVTSSSKRCRDTVAPLAERLGIALELEDALSEEAFETDPKAARTLVGGLKTAGEAVVVCTHRPLLATMARVIDLDLPRRARSNPLPKGACWVSHAQLKTEVERYTS